MIVIECYKCHRVYQIKASDEAKKEYYLGLRLVQEIFPNLDREMRELLISKTCPTCWDEMFNDEDIDPETED